MYSAAPGLDGSGSNRLIAAINDSGSNRNFEIGFEYLDGYRQSDYQYSHSEYGLRKAGRFETLLSLPEIKLYTSIHLQPFTSYLYSLLYLKFPPPCYCYCT